MEDWRGHYILAPKDASPPDTSMIYINIGGVLCGNQKFPDYHYGLMQSICSQKQYRDLVREIRAFFSPPPSSRH